MLVCVTYSLIVEVHHAEQILHCLLGLWEISAIVKLCMRLLEEKLELFFDPCDHLVISEENAALA